MFFRFHGWEVKLVCFFSLILHSALTKTTHKDASMNEYQWENYNRACQDLRKQQGPPEVENVVKALKKGFNMAPAILGEKLKKNGRELWINLGAMIWNAVVYIFKVQATAVTICATVGGVLTPEIPLVGAAIGARIGVFVANAYFALIGMHSLATMAGQVAGSVSVYFEEGVRKARAGDIDGGAKQFAEGFAQMMQMIIAIFIIYCFVKGGNRAMEMMKKTFTSESRLLTQLKHLPPAISNLQALRHHPRWGYAIQEIQAMRQMSLEDTIHVIRTCNPSRLSVRGAKGVPLEAKGLEIKGKSFKGGLYEGQVGVSASDLEKLSKNYELQPIKINPNLVSGPKNLAQEDSFRLKLKPGKSGELDGHILEQTNYSGFSQHAEDLLKWRILDKQGNPHIPDMDRLVAMRLNVKEMRLEEMARRMDDPIEIENFNKTFNEIVGNKGRVNKVPVKHGYTSTSLNKKGEPVWHADTNETLLVFVNGKMFEMTWNQFVWFCEANKVLNMPSCFKYIN